MTDYVILRKDPGANPHTWHEYGPDYGTVEASSPRRALVSAGVPEGEWVAIPARSWKPLTVKVQQTTKVTIT